MNVKNLFNFKVQKDLSVTLAPTHPLKSTKETIEEIHHSFYTEVDRLLADAKISKSLDTTKQDLLDKCDRLEKLGFTSTKEVQEAKLEIQRIEKLKAENENNKVLVEAIDYFSMKYPNYKFITEESVGKICEKYGLIYGEIGRYIGTVPNANINQMEDFKINEVDMCYAKKEISIYGWGDTTTPCSFEQFNRKSTKEPVALDSTDNISLERYFMMQQMHAHSNHITSFEKLPLEIAASQKDFNMKDMELKGQKLSKIEIPDPVVLQPVFFKGQKHYLVVTAWGLEASDELVVNQKMN